jgi:RNA polymerase sigma-70 factor (ECF subfamily)
VSVATAAPPPPEQALGPRHEGALLEALRRGDETAFLQLVDAYAPQMLRVALLHVSSRAVAEEVVQETWLGVLNGLDRFEGRSSLKTWIFRILTNQAKTRGVRERRTLPFSALAGDDDAPTVDPALFEPADDRWAGHWRSYPEAWARGPEAAVVERELLGVIRTAVDALPLAQRTVMSLRDIEGWDAAEVCDLLEISEVHQRVLLHRARARVRRAIDERLGAGGTP